MSIHYHKVTEITPTSETRQDQPEAGATQPEGSVNE